MTVAAARKLLRLHEGGKPAAPISSAGRPRNYVLPVRLDDSEITYVSTGLTAQQWRRKGGAKAFWDAIRALVNRKDIQERLEHDLG